MASDLEARVGELESKVRELVDREALRDLRYRYHEFINEGRFAEIADLFTEDGELEFGPLGSARGRERMRSFFEHLSAPDQARGPQFTFVKQYIHNHVLEITGDRARGFSYLEAKPIINGEAYMVSGRYDDDYVRQDGRWLFTRMKFTLHFAVPHDEGWAGERIRLGGRGQRE